MSDELIKELRSYPEHYTAAHKAADKLEYAAKWMKGREYYASRLEDDLIKAEQEAERLREHIAQQQLDIVALGQEVGRLQEVLEYIASDDMPRVVGKRYRADGKPSKNDLCLHGVFMWMECVACVADYARAALAEQEK